MINRTSARPQGWFRVYCDILKSRKLRRRISESDAWRFILILAAHKETETRDVTGDVTRDVYTSLTPFESVGDLAFYCGFPDERDFAETVRRLTDAGLLADDMTPLNWNKRQFKSDTSADRQRKCRERKRSELGVISDVTGDVTGDVTSDVTVTASETEDKKRRRRRHRDYLPEDLREGME